MTIKAAVIGAGEMGRSHMGSLNEVPEIELTAVVDPYEKAAVAAAEEFQIPQTYAQVSEMLERERPDYVVVVSPPLYHAEQTIAAYAAGAHVLCEKPLCMSVAEAESMRDAARRSGKLFTMGLQLRQMHTYEAVRQFLALGKLGDVYHSRVWAGHHHGISSWPILSPSGILPRRGFRWHRRAFPGSSHMDPGNTGAG